MRYRPPYWAGVILAGLVLLLVAGRLWFTTAPRDDRPPGPCLHDNKLYSHGASRRDQDRYWQCASGDWVPVES